MRTRRRLLAVACVLAAVATACSGDGADPASTDGATNSGQASGSIAAQVASFDLAVGQDQRLLVGLFGPERGVIGGGQVQVRVGFLGAEQPSGSVETELSDPVTATFLPVPGTGTDAGDAPAVLDGGAGVYEAAVDLDQAGFWGAQVSVQLDGETRTATAAFQVGEEHRVPAPGDPAPRTENPTIESTPGSLPRSTDVAPVAIDSRAQGEGGIPDPMLHDASVADVLEAGRPLVVVISTPVYCVSRFCGPITEFVAGLQDSYGDRAEFVHLEVWQDFESNKLNPYVEEWIFDPETGGNEPWVFLVGADGTIRARWDNVLDAAELTSLLEELPAG